MSDKNNFESELLNDLFEDAKVSKKKPMPKQVQKKEVQEDELFDFLEDEPQVKNPANIKKPQPQSQQGQGVSMHGNKPTVEQQRAIKKAPVANGSLGNKVKPATVQSTNTRNPYENEEQVNKSKQVVKKKEKKKLTKSQKTILKVAGIVILVAILGFSGFKIYDSVREKPLSETAYEETGRRAVDEYIKLVKSFDYEALNKTAEENFDSKISYVAMEQKYANSGEPELKFLSKVFDVIKVKYPQVALQSNRGRDYINKSGEKTMIDSDLKDGEPVTLTIVDWGTLANQITADSANIANLFVSNGYNKGDLDITNKMSKMFCNYVNSLQTLPTKEIEWTPSLTNVGKTVKVDEKTTKDIDYFVVNNDDMLDSLILGSDEYHLCLDSFGKAATSWTPIVQEEYTGTNLKYTKWKKQLSKIKKYYKKKKEEYPGGKKLIKYNKKMKLEKYTKGKKKGQYKYIKTPKKKAKLKRDIDNPYVPEICLPYTYLGAYYAQNGYNNGQTKVMPLLGNGTFQQPAGVGTPVLTKVKYKGEFYDCRVTLKAYYAGQSAINYASKYSEKNRGFLSNNKVQLSCYEVDVENLSGKKLRISEDLALCDERNDMSPRTGLMYGFKLKGTVKAGETITLQSYLVGTDIENKYLIWGRSFDRKYEPVWFRVLKNNQEELKPMLDENNSDITNEGNTSDITNEENTSDITNEQ